MANPTPKTSSTRVQLPVGPSGTEPPNAPEGGLAYATDTELVRVKTSTGWEDVGSGGGGGSITSIVEGPGIDITGGTGPVVTVSVDPSEISLVGDANGPLDANTVNAIHETSGPTKLTIGNINDFQLLQRVGATVVGTAYPPTTLVGDVNGPIISNTVNAIHETSGPTQLTIGAISSGQVLIRSGATVIGSTAGTPTGNPYVDPPVSANAFDDEFESGSADLATRGWTVKTSAGVTLTRAGNVDPWSASGPAAGTYWSTMFGSQIQIQVPVSTAGAWIYKSVGTLTAGDTFFFRGSWSSRFDATTASLGCVASLTASTGGNPDFANRVYANCYSGAASGFALDMGRVTASATASTNKVAGFTPDILGVHWTSGTTYYPFSANSQIGTTLSSAPAGAVNGSTIAFFVVSLDPGSTTYAGTLPWIVSLDFVRRVTASNAGNIAQTPRPVAWNVVNADITNYTVKSAPVAADQVYIADSAASNAIRRATVASISPRIPWISAPDAPNTSFDDEFTSGSADLATRGWAIVDATTFTTQTRAGDIIPFTATPPAANTYRSTIISGCLCMQFPQGKGVFITKAATLPSTTPAYGGFLSTRVTPYWSVSQTATSWYLGALALNRVAGAVTQSRSIQVLTNWSQGGLCPGLYYAKDGVQIRLLNSATAGTDLVGDKDIYGLRLIENSGTALLSPLYASSGTLRVSNADTLSSTRAISAWTDFGLYYQAGTLAAGTNYAMFDFSIDYIRLAVGDMTNVVPM